MPTIGSLGWGLIYVLEEFRRVFIFRLGHKLNFFDATLLIKLLRR